jgi:hypothetical protein
VIGDGVLAPSDLRTFQASSDFNTYMTPVLMHSVVIINSGKTPTDSFDLRKTIMHGVNKAEIIKNELNGIGQAVDRLFPESAPYSNLELTPRWDYDFQKATLLNCEAVGALPPMPDPPTYDFCSKVKELERNPEPEQNLGDIKEATNQILTGDDSEVDEVSSTVITSGVLAAIAGLF